MFYFNLRGYLSNILLLKFHQRTYKMNLLTRGFPRGPPLKRLPMPFTIRERIP